MAAAGFAGWRNLIASNQAKNEEQGQITDRFAKAVELLGSKNSTVRTGAVFALGRIALDSNDHIPAMQILSNFVRHSPNAKKQEAAATSYFVAIEVHAQGGPRPEQPMLECPDILAAMRVIAERTGQQRAWEDTQQHDLTLFAARLPFANLTRATLSGATINVADLRGANLTFADLEIANLTGADLSHAILDGANLRDAKLYGANLRSASLKHTQLHGADFTNSDLSGARLFSLSLAELEFTNTSFARAKLIDVDFGQTKLKRVDLTGASLSSARNLTADQLSQSYVTDPNAQPTLPDLPEFQNLTLKYTPKDFR